MKKVVSLLLLIIVVLIAGVGCSSKSDRKSYKYGNTAIEILNRYKDRQLSEKDAKKQLKDLKEQATSESEKVKSKDMDESKRLKELSDIVDSAQISVSLGSVASINDIIEQIEKLNK